MIKVIGLVSRRPDVSREEFIRHWREEHAPIVRKLPNLRKYTIAPTAAPEDAPYDGVAELYYDSFEAMKEGDDTETMARIRRDEQRFLESVDILVVEESVEIEPD